ncbi:hypothetical protein MAR_008269 [Mya arenaria]|uniref:Uncharacterized protein n=1 Tax=Mya arenaria TaxID=6604 RepID=A0ABY7DZM2_MYAAR|nr:hypothetical protein MAR_008269 [Mya arenaria]
MDAMQQTKVRNIVWRDISSHLRRGNIVRFARRFVAAFSRAVSCLRPRLDKSAHDWDWDSDLILEIPSYRTSAQLGNSQRSTDPQGDLALRCHEAAVRCRALEAAMDFGLDIKSTKAMPARSPTWSKTTRFSSSTRMDGTSGKSPAWSEAQTMSSAASAELSSAASVEMSSAASVEMSSAATAELSSAASAELSSAASAELSAAASAECFDGYETDPSSTGSYIESSRCMSLESSCRRQQGFWDRCSSDGDSFHDPGFPTRTSGSDFQSFSDYLRTSDVSFLESFKAAPSSPEDSQRAPSEHNSEKALTSHSELEDSTFATWSTWSTLSSTEGCDEILPNPRRCLIKETPTGRPVAPQQRCLIGYGMKPRRLLADFIRANQCIADEREPTGILAIATRGEPDHDWSESVVTGGARTGVSLENSCGDDGSVAMDTSGVGSCDCQEEQEKRTKLRRFILESGLDGFDVLDLLMLPSLQTDSGTDRSSVLITAVGELEGPKPLKMQRERFESGMVALNGKWKLVYTDKVGEYSDAIGISTARTTRAHQEL